MGILVGRKSKSWWKQERRGSASTDIHTSKSVKKVRQNMSGVKRKRKTSSKRLRSTRSSMRKSRRTSFHHSPSTSFGTSTTRLDGRELRDAAERKPWWSRYPTFWGVSDWYLFMIFTISSTSFIKWCSSILLLIEVYYQWQLSYIAHLQVST